jgi:manganese/zinc/iron transport system permease protein
MPTLQLEIIILAVLTALACALPGVFLVLRRMALMSDAISHAILLGIVLAFFATKSLSSPWLIAGAALTGVFTVALTEMIITTRKLKEDAAIGLVFPLLFSIGVILISRRARDIHLDIDAVLLGEIAFAPFNRLIINQTDFGPAGFWVMGAALALNIIFVALFYKELKIVTFDPGLAAALGFFPLLVNYLLMTLVSVTAVAAFENAGSILVVALMIAPPAAAYLLTNRLGHMIAWSLGIGAVSAVSGYFLAFRLDASIAGSMAAMAGACFTLALVFAPEHGLLARFLVRKYRKWDLATETLAVHLLQAEYTHAEEAERVVSHMKDHMLWNDRYTSETIAQALENGLIKKSGNKLSLTKLGREKAKNTLAKE